MKNDLTPNSQPQTSEGFPCSVSREPCSGNWYIDQRRTGWDAMFTFSGKERDEETGYGYFGARYYDSDISIWLSVDPMAGKYPSLSPYVYCANNPVIYIDPNGEDLELTFYTCKYGNTKDEFTKIVNQGLGGQFEADYKQIGEGKYILDLKATKDGGDMSKLSTE